jgi:hypothetical protein
MPKGDGASAALEVSAHSKLPRIVLNIRQAGMPLAAKGYGMSCIADFKFKIACTHRGPIDAIRNIKRQYALSHGWSVTKYV